MPLHILHVQQELTFGKYFGMWDIVPLMKTIGQKSFECDKYRIDMTDWKNEFYPNANFKSVDDLLVDKDITINSICISDGTKHTFTITMYLEYIMEGNKATLVVMAPTAEQCTQVEQIINTEYAAVLKLNQENGRTYPSQPTEEIQLNKPKKPKQPKTKTKTKTNVLTIKVTPAETPKLLDRRFYVDLQKVGYGAFLSALEGIEALYFTPNNVLFDLSINDQPVTRHHGFQFASMQRTMSSLGTYCTLKTLALETDTTPMLSITVYINSDVLEARMHIVASLYAQMFIDSLFVSMPKGSIIEK